MSVRFPRTWRVEPEAHYWRARRPHDRTRLPRRVVGLLARLHRWVRRLARG